MALKRGVVVINKIVGELARIELENQVRILYAVESGSRGWGFASEDSDYDVRFIYIRPLEDYISIDTPKDYVEVPINNLLDINGWDIRKALKLYQKSNPPLMEWLSSPIVYKEEHSLAEKLRGLSGEYFSPIPSLHHYLNLAKNTYKEMQATDQVKLKKYFYVLRPLMACKWIEEYETMAPMDFHILLSKLSINADIRSEINALLNRKLVSTELDVEPINRRLYHYFNHTIAYYENRIRLASRELNPNKTALDALFRSTLQEVWAVNDLRLIR